MQFTLMKESKEKCTNYEAAIIGAGPAGLTAAIYLSRARIDTVVFEKLIPGGLIASTDWIENYPGFPDGLSGGELGERMKRHSLRFGAKIEDVEVTGVALDSENISIKTAEGTYSASALIVASGTSPVRLNVSGEENFIGKGISFCAACDAPFFEGEDIVVVGAGSSGIQESLYLSKFARSIKIVEFLSHPTAEQILLDRIKDNDKIELLLFHKVIGFIGEDSLSGVEVESRETGEKKVLDVSGAFIYVGLSPNTGFLDGLLDVDPKEFIKTDPELRTSREGVFAAGDVRTTSLRQVATAVGDGALAAHKVIKYLEKKNEG